MEWGEPAPAIGADNADFELVAISVSRMELNNTVVISSTFIDLLLHHLMSLYTSFLSYTARYIAVKMTILTVSIFCHRT